MTMMLSCQPVQVVTWSLYRYLLLQRLSPPAIRYLHTFNLLNHQHQELSKKRLYHLKGRRHPRKSLKNTKPCSHNRYTRQWNKWRMSEVRKKCCWKKDSWQWPKKACRHNKLLRWRHNCKWPLRKKIMNWPIN